MKSLTDLVVSIITDAGNFCAVNTRRDCKTVLSRVACEGEGFLTITLASFGKAFEQCLSLGLLDPNLFPSWKKRDGAPVFLRGFLDLVFDPTSHLILERASVESILAIRQITLMSAKIFSLPSPSREAEAYERYLEVERDLRSEIQPDWDGFLKTSRLLWSELFSNISKEIETNFQPGHGSGAVATRERGNQKWLLPSWTERLQRAFPVEHWGRSSYHDDRPYRLLRPFGGKGARKDCEIPARIIAVPKTASTARIIAMEPVYNMYIQQGLHRIFQRLFSEDRYASIFVDYSSQEPNQLLARKGSIDGSLATLDLKDASDRVRMEHIQNLLSGFPILLQDLESCRSEYAQVNSKVIKLRKFASMGSALTFPLEALVFCTIAILGVAKAVQMEVTPKLISKLKGSVRVYGDDIIVPTPAAPYVVKELEAFGLVVNRTKSFWTGKFRESCGSDWYDGIDVSICRIRQPLPHSRRNSEGVISLSSLRNQLASKALWPGTVSAIDNLLLSILGGDYPFVPENSGVIGRIRIDGLYDIHRFEPHIQTPMVRAWVPSSRSPLNGLNGYPALLKHFTRISEDPYEADHLLRSGRPATVRLKRRWARVV